MLPVRCHVAAVRIVGDRDVAREKRLGLFAPVHHLDAVDLLVLPGCDCLLDLGEIEDYDMVHLGLCHLLQRHALFGIVAGGERPLALVVGIAIVEVARYLHLPGHIPLVGIDSGEDVHVGRHVRHR
ncbi:hypothetical protein D9M68_252140 [compost metagenome]